MALHAVPAYRTSTYLVSVFPVHSTSFSPKILQSSTSECVLSSESDFLLVVGIHLVSPCNGCKRLWTTLSSGLLLVSVGETRTIWTTFMRLITTPSSVICDLTAARLGTPFVLISLIPCQ